MRAEGENQLGEEVRVTSDKCSTSDGVTMCTMRDGVTMDQATRKNTPRASNTLEVLSLELSNESILFIADLMTVHGDGTSPATSLGNHSQQHADHYLGTLESQHHDHEVTSNSTCREMSGKTVDRDGTRLGQLLEKISLRTARRTCRGNQSSHRHTG